jgi:site-specific recombinase XerD
MAKTKPVDCSPDLEKLLADYDLHLKEVRGLTSETRGVYRWGAQRFLRWLGKRRSDASQSGQLIVRAHDVLDFVIEQLRAHAGFGPAWRKSLCSETRSFLRYLYWREIVGQDLSLLVPTVSGWRLSSLPRHISWNQVRMLLDSVGVSTPLGKRDKALLAAVALLGLRNQEVRTLKLDQIDWRAGEIRLPHTKTGRERVLPLSDEVGKLLADYLLHGRPRADFPYVFLRHRPRPGPISDRHMIAQIVRKRLKHAGIEAPCRRRGAYLLRHSLATHLVNARVPIKHIADVLGHASIDTTAIYTKVATTSLSEVALPFPGGVA